MKIRTRLFDPLHIVRVTQKTQASVTADRIGDTEYSHIRFDLGGGARQLRTGDIARVTFDCSTMYDQGYVLRQEYLKNYDPDTHIVSFYVMIPAWGNEAVRRNGDSVLIAYAVLFENASKAVRKAARGGEPKYRGESKSGGESKLGCANGVLHVTEKLPAPETKTVNHAAGDFGQSQAITHQLQLVSTPTEDDIIKFMRSVTELGKELTYEDAKNSGKI